MATYFHTPNNQRESSPMIYTRESWPGSTNPEPSPVISTNMMMYMNYLSSTNEMPPPQQEPLSDLGDENDFSAWAHGRGEMPFLPPIGSATSLLQGVQNLQNQSQNQNQNQNQNQGLSLTLSTQIPSTIQIPSIDFRNSSTGFSSFLSPDNNNNNSNNIRDEESSPNKQMRSGEYGMHTGYVTENSANYGVTSVGRTVPNSKYLRAAQQLLDEVVNVRNALKKRDSKSGEGLEGESRSENKFPPASEASSNPQDFTSSSKDELSAAEKQDLQNKLSKLMTMLDEVDRRYKQYYHQMQIVVSSFDVVAGHGSAKPYTALALQTISRHFRCLRDAIANQIRSVRKSLGENDGSENGKGNVGISRLRYVDQHLKQQKALQQLGMMQTHAWRPQRGLPESSVSILRAWLFEHFLHPYPKDSEKIMLARQTGLTRSQVSNWFINARVRLWKPMVEEMYKEETGEAEIDSLSSPETGNKATRKDTNAPEDTNNQDLQQYANSTEQSKNAKFLESKHSPISDMETTRVTNPIFQNETNQRVELRPCLDDNNGLFEGYQIPGFGRFGNPNGVSLTLGLQHRETGTQNFVDNQNFAIYNDESSFT